jgi:hypothetical protein
LAGATEGTWSDADVALGPLVRSLVLQRKTEGGKEPPLLARDIVFRAAAEAELLVDDVLLYEPGVEKTDDEKSAKP